jgi:hypothetical protein
VKRTNFTLLDDDKPGAPTDVLVDLYLGRGEYLGTQAEFLWAGSLPLA